MKLTKQSVFLSLGAIIVGLTAASASIAAAPALYLSPASATKTAGETITVNVGVSAAGSKVFAVEGSLTFNKLTCQSIVVADGVTAQSAPSCDNPKFLLGIPSGTTGDKPLFTIAAKTDSVGTASLNVSGVDIIGEGKSLSTAAASGSYDVVSAEPVKTTIVAEVVSEPVAPVVAPKRAVNDAPPVEVVATDATSTDSIASEPAGSVLAGFEQTEAEESAGWPDWLQSTASRVVFGALILAILAYLAMRMMKKKEPPLPPLPPQQSVPPQA